MLPSLSTNLETSSPFYKESGIQNCFFKFLPMEVILLILSNSEVKDLDALRRTCRSFKICVESPVIFKLVAGILSMPFENDLEKIKAFIDLRSEFNKRVSQSIKIAGERRKIALVDSQALYKHLEIVICEAEVLRKKYSDVFEKVFNVSNSRALFVRKIPEFLIKSILAKLPPRSYIDVYLTGGSYIAGKDENNQIQMSKRDFSVSEYESHSQSHEAFTQTLDHMVQNFQEVEVWGDRFIRTTKNEVSHYLESWANDLGVPIEEFREFEQAIKELGQIRHFTYPSHGSISVQIHWKANFKHKEKVRELAEAIQKKYGKDSYYNHFTSPFSPLQAATAVIEGLLSMKGGKHCVFSFDGHPSNILIYNFFHNIFIVTEFKTLSDLSEDERDTLKNWNDQILIEGEGIRNFCVPS